MYKKMILLLLIVLVILIPSCSNKKNKPSNNIKSTQIDESAITNESSSSQNEVYIQWQYRSSETAHELEHKVYELYLYNSKTNETQYIISFSQGLSPIFNNKHLTVNNEKSIMDCSSWYAGGGIGLSVFYLDNMLKVYEAYFEEWQEPFLSSKPVYDLKLSPTDKVIILPQKELDTPNYCRELQLLNPRLFGDDIRYLQAVINNFYSIKLDIDGYYGLDTEIAVKNIQNEMKLLETGIVTLELWKEITNTKEKYYQDSGQYLIK